MTKRNDIELLFRAHYAQMHRIAAALLHDDELARDIVHDVFVTLLDGSHDIIVSGGYLMKAVKNRCLNHIRDCEIHQRIANFYFLDDGEYDSEGWPDEETISCLGDLIETDISPQARRVIDLRFKAGMPFSKIAAEMGISETAVYRHLRHALILIRQKLNQNG